MSDFKNQAEIITWLAEDESRRIRHRENGDVVGMKGGYLYFFSNGHHTPCDYNLRWNIDRWKKVKPKVKYLKSIRQILNEYPDAQWCLDGGLWHHKWVRGIAREMFYYFGGPVSAISTEWHCIPEWIEEREGE